MPLFTYRAKKGPSEIITETIEAENREEVISRLSHEGLFPVSITLQGEVKNRAIATGGWFSKVKTRDINTVTRQLSSLLKAGVPLLRALQIITDQTENVHLRNIVMDLGVQIKQGQTLSTAMSRYAGMFPPFYTAVIKSGEDSGALPEVINRLTEYREQVEEIKSRIRAALAYPILVVFFGFGAIVFMMMMVIPRMQNVLKTINAPLKWNTRLLLGVSDVLSTHWYLVLTGVVLLLLVLRGIALIDKKVLDRLKLGIPFINTFIRKSECAKVARTTSLLLTNGIPILSALEIVVPTLGSEPIKEALKKIANDLRSGQTMAGGMRNSPYFFPFMTNMVAVGEESGHLDDVLNEVSVFYEREIDEAIKIALSLLEPLLIIILALIVGFMVVSVLLPIFQMSSMFQ